MLAKIAEFVRGNRKAAAAIAALAVTVIGGVLRKCGITVEDAAIWGAVVPLVAYILGQGAADHGKEAAKVQAAEAQAKAEELRAEAQTLAARGRELAEQLRAAEDRAAAAERVIAELQTALAAKGRPRAKG